MLNLLYFGDFLTFFVGIAPLIK